MQGGRRTIPHRFLFSLLCILVSLWGCATQHFLVLTDVTDGERPETLIMLPMEPAEQFRVCFIHSWDLTPVTDIYAVGRHGEIVIKEEVFDWFGAGLEHNPPRGRLVIGPDKRLHVRDINRNVDSFRVRVGVVAHHVLEVRDLRIPLNTLTRPMNPIEFRIVSP
jgi:hypothetical protein